MAWFKLQMNTWKETHNIFLTMKITNNRLLCFSSSLECQISIREREKYDLSDHLLSHLASSYLFQDSAYFSGLVKTSINAILMRKPLTIKANLSRKSCLQSLSLFMNRLLILQLFRLRIKQKSMTLRKNYLL